jgi:release factor glutamine methyltransferase
MPEGDTEFLLDVVLAEGVPPGARVLDVGTGTGRLALAMAAGGAAQVTAVDISSRAVLAARFNAKIRRLPVQVRFGDMFTPVAHERYDIVLANPPYVPSPDAPPTGRSPARAWDGGPDGRVLVDRVCREAPGVLAPRGTLWMVHSALCDSEVSVAALADAGLDAAVAARCEVPFGPVMRSRAQWLEERGFIEPGQDVEELVVIRAQRP